MSESMSELLKFLCGNQFINGSLVGWIVDYYTMSQKMSHIWLAITLTCEQILYFFSRNVTNKASNQKTLYYATLINLCFCTTW